MSSTSGSTEASLVATSATSVNPYDDPFHLSTSDYATSQLISLNLTNENYHIWSSTILTALEGRNKQGLVDDTIKAPDVSDSKYASWRRCNSVVITWLRNCMDSKIAASLSKVATARDLWVELEHRYSPSNAPRIYELKKEIASISQGILSVTDYYTRIKAFWDELYHYRPLPTVSTEAMEILLSYQHQDCVMQFLMGLNDTYAHVRSQILLMDPLPPINKVYSLVLQEERQRAITSAVPTFSEPSAMAVKTQSFAEQRKFNRATNNTKEGLFCTHCKRQGHVVDRCYKLHGFPSNLQRRQKGFSNPNLAQNARSSINEVEAGITQSANSVSSLQLTPEQCQQLMAFLQLQSHSGNSSVSGNQTGSDAQNPPNQNMSSVSAMAGPSHLEDDWNGNYA
ncbi:uncharacterized protein LOC120007200 [Tripterygium wilfordii]|uniref:uncharacterized protein LOC120007200 n=1 Tax=Tripterygium wilfordii TaxID=458696 RepID=UPI0018F80440|nr:uncharacterized protein LOC120007200 [Tripterygium wilfordii]